MENLEKISLFSVLLALILALFVSNAVHAVGVTDTITVGGGILTARHLKRGDGAGPAL